mgnify:CR=1 FL=1
MSRLILISISILFFNNILLSANLDDGLCEYPGCTDSTYLDHKAFNTLEASIKNDKTVEPTPSLMSKDQTQEKNSKENPSIKLSSIFHINTNGMLAFNDCAPPANAA